MESAVAGGAEPFDGVEAHLAGDGGKGSLYAQGGRLRKSVYWKTYAAGKCPFTRAQRQCLRPENGAPGQRAPTVSGPPDAVPGGKNNGGNGENKAAGPTVRPSSSEQK